MLRIVYLVSQWRFRSDFFPPSQISFRLFLRAILTLIELIGFELMKKYWYFSSILNGCCCCRRRNSTWQCTEFFVCCWFGFCFPTFQKKLISWIHFFEQLSASLFDSNCHLAKDKSGRTNLFANVVQKSSRERDWTRNLYFWAVVKTLDTPVLVHVP